MAKHIDSEILGVLRAYELAGELTGKKAIRDIKEYPARQLTRLVKFLYDRRSYYLLFDTSAGDDVAVVLAHIKQDVPDVKGHLVRNPLDDSRKAYGIPYRGKDVYLFAKEIVKNRLDHELVRRHPDLTRSTIQKYVKAGYVSVNGVPVLQARHEVTEHDDISMVPPVKESHDELELPIIYIDDNVIVVNKPTGVLTHSKGVLNHEFTVADFFRRYTSFGLETNRPGIIHRLDRDTSGIIVGARNEATALMLKKQFADRTTKKEYVAVLSALPKQMKAVIDLPIARNPSAPSTHRIDPSGKIAQTTYEVTKTRDDGLSLVTLLPKTGRTHQLRVHTQYINTPILGDRVYGGKKADRLFLHAHKLEITIPDSKRVTFTAPVPKEFNELFK